MIVVCNSSPIISLATIEKLDLLESVFKEIHIPVAVYDEVVVQGENKPGVQPVIQADWITTVPVKDKDVVAVLRATYHLGIGEAEAIVLAEQLQADWLLLDDLAARNAGEQRALRFIGTLGILLLAKDLGLLTNIREVLEELVVSGFHVSDSLYQRILARSGEI